MMQDEPVLHLTPGRPLHRSMKRTESGVQLVIAGGAEAMPRGVLRDAKDRRR